MIFFIALNSVPLSLFAADERIYSVEENIIEQADNTYDIDEPYIKSKGAWLAVPIPVSNPTIGTGLQAALLYLHAKDSAESEIPNATSGLVGMYTNTDSWLVGGFHDGNWGDDLYRYRLMLGTGEFNLDFYGIGNGLLALENPVKYNLMSDVLFSQLLRRFPGTLNWYLGARYLYIDSNVTFFAGNTIPDLPDISANKKNSGLGLIVLFDSRNDNYYPTKGINFEFAWMRDSNKWGSDFEFDKLDTNFNGYVPVSPDITLALRTVFSRAMGDTPFYLLPTLKMRGFANGVYKDDIAMSGHAEWRHKFKPRWGYVAFFEIGSTASSTSDLFTTTITSYGAGIRWQITKDKKLNLGVDIGFSDNNSAIYVQVGEKF